jgi:hypothetical protein
VCALFVVIIIHAFVTIHETANGAVTTNGSVEWDNATEEEMV